MFRVNLQGVHCRYLDRLVRASVPLPRSGADAVQQNARHLSANRAPKQKGLLGKFVDNLKEGFQRDKEMQKNIKKFQEEAEKFEESSAFKTAKKQFGVLSAVKERTSEGVTKLSSTLKDGGEQLSEKASKVVEEIKLSETFKRGQQVSEELSKSAQETFSKVKEHGEELGKTETLKTVSMGLKTVKEELFDPIADKSKPYQRPGKFINHFLNISKNVNYDILYMYTVYSFVLKLNFDKLC